MLPVENSLGGSIHIVYDLLLRYRLHIVAEVSIEVRRPRRGPARVFGVWGPTTPSPLG